MGWTDGLGQNAVVASAVVTAVCAGLQVRALKRTNDLYRRMNGVDERSERRQVADELARASDAEQVLALWNIYCPARHTRSTFVQGVLANTTLSGPETILVLCEMDSNADPAISPRELERVFLRSPTVETYDAICALNWNSTTRMNGQATKWAIGRNDAELDEAVIRNLEFMDIESLYVASDRSLGGGPAVMLELARRLEESASTRGLRRDDTISRRERVASWLKLKALAFRLRGEARDVDPLAQAHLLRRTFQNLGRKQETDPTPQIPPPRVQHPSRPITCLRNRNRRRPR